MSLHSIEALQTNDWGLIDKLKLKNENHCLAVTLVAIALTMRLTKHIQVGLCKYMEIGLMYMLTFKWYQISCKYWYFGDHNGRKKKTYVTMRSFFCHLSSFQYIWNQLGCGPLRMNLFFTLNTEMLCDIEWVVIRAS